jgi:hypothetical protein
VRDGEAFVSVSVGSMAAALSVARGRPVSSGELVLFSRWLIKVE